MKKIQIIGTESLGVHELCCAVTVATTYEVKYGAFNGVNRHVFDLTRIIFVRTLRFFDHPVNPLTLGDAA